uniref:Hpt domain-containing protein n=1 Tax=Pseudarthrobacter oxydans TaxID=1671 RepID=UPI003F4941AC
MPLELTVIRALAEALEDPSAALTFLLDFLSMLPARMQRILVTLRDEDPEPALDAIISLKVTAAMTGASGIEASCRNIELLVRAGRFPHAVAAAEDLCDQVMAMIAATPRLLVSATETLTRFGPVLSHS